MQALVDLVGTITGSIQRIIALVLVAGLILSLIVMFGLQSAAPVVADKIGERAERMGDKAIQAAREEHRAAALAKDGWGYDSSSADSERGRVTGTTKDTNGDNVGGWGTD